MITPKDLEGCIPAVATPVKGFGLAPEVDYDHLESHLVHLLEGGITRFVLAATTGMGSLLSEKEHVDVVVFGSGIIRDCCKARDITPIIIAGAGSNCANEAVNRTVAIAKTGRVHALLHTAGYYVGGSPAGFHAQFTAVADAAESYETGVILYNVPSRTTANFGVALPQRLSEHPAIIGIKEASGDLGQIDAILQNTDRESFAVLSGEDHQVAEIMRLGGIGVISASANIWPREFSRLTELGLAGRHQEAAELQQALLPCVNAVFPPGVKSPQTIQHMLGTGARLPLVGVNQLDTKQRDMCLELIKQASGIQIFPHMKQ